MTAQNNDDLLPTRFAEIRVTGGRRVRIKVSNDDGRLIWGFGVDRHGVVPRAGKDHEERQFFACAPQDVIRELRMSKHHGELVPLKCSPPNSAHQLTVSPQSGDSQEIGRK